jgi:hypothetical protein
MLEEIKTLRRSHRFPFSEVGFFSLAEGVFANDHR